jgi:trehalose 6-phosphate synthase
MLIAAKSGIPTTIRSVTFDGRMVTVGAFPIGIQPERFTETLAETRVQERIAALEQKFQGQTVMVGVDRLDYMKGVPQKLRAFELFLMMHPEYVGRVVLIQVAIPTRGEVEEYQNLRSLVNELIGRINGKFGMLFATFQG